MKKTSTSYAEYLKIPPKKFYDLGVLNPILDKDVNLFIDPRLLKNSRYEMFNTFATKTYETFYKSLAGNIKAYLQLTDDKIKTKAKQNIIKKLTAKEPVGLGLGYSKSGTNGQGVGKYNAEILFKNALDIYKCVPNIGEEAFSLLNLLSEVIGADYIGDITANIIMYELVKFTESTAKKLNISTEKFIMNGSEFMLPVHPNSTIKKRYPVLLVPKDILSELPKDADMKDVLEGYADKNRQIRTDIDEKILNILKQEHIEKKDKQIQIFDILKEIPELIEELTKYMSSLEGNKYDFEKDSKGIIIRDKLLDYLIVTLKLKLITI